MRPQRTAIPNTISIVNRYDNPFATAGATLLNVSAFFNHHSQSDSELVCRAGFERTIWSSSTRASGVPIQRNDAFIKLACMRHPNLGLQRIRSWSCFENASHDAKQQGRVERGRRASEKFGKISEARLGCTKLTEIRLTFLCWTHEFSMLESFRVD